MDDQVKICIPDQYETEKSEYIEDIEMSAYILRHKKSGARIAVFPNDDPNKLFCIAFYTPPENSKGTPHIIEHTVLQGSRKYPAREPFMQLVKGSLNTFLNAFTYPDKTVYPVSSCNDVDFKNLMDVYLDAVFHPNLYSRREIFQQEGWHYETDERGDIILNGVVYNEMKGASSSPDSNVFDEILTALYPDNAYGFSSGGDPEEIPTLSYEEYLDFHRKYYKPSNSFIMLYGNFDPEERLIFLDREYLSSYDVGPEVPRIPAQQEFGKGRIRSVNLSYPIGEDENKEQKTFLALASRVGTVHDEVKSVAWDILGDIIVNDPEAVLKKSLSDEGIGQEIFGGYYDYIGEPFFTVIAKNTDADKADRFKSIIDETLNRLKNDGVNKKTLTAIIERSEFKFRESAYGSYPKGLDLFKMMLKGWLYGDEDPFKYVKFLKILGILKNKVNEGYFEELIHELITSPHSVFLSLTPENGLEKKKDNLLKHQLKEFKTSLDDNGFNKIVLDFENLRKYQEAPETKEERNCIPVLPKGSISLDPEPIHNSDYIVDGVPYVLHDVETHGIVYSRILFDVSDIAVDELPYLDLLAELLGNCSTGSYACRELIDEVRTSTGGIEFDIVPFRDYRDPSTFRPYFTVSVRTLIDKTEKAFDLVREIITRTDFGDIQRIKEVLGETVSEKTYDALYSGSEFSSVRCFSGIDPVSVFNDMTEGIGSLHVQSRLYSDYENNSEIISNKLKSLYTRIFGKNRAIVSLAMPEKTSDRVFSAFKAVFNSIDKCSDLGLPSLILPRGIINEAFTCASGVQYVSLCSDLGFTDDSFRRLSPLISKFLTDEILYQEIRVKGGSYGTFFTAIPNSGKIVMSSYRDPGLKKTLDVFTSVYDKIRSSMPDAEKLWQLVIGTFSRIDRPLTAYQKMCRSMNFHMCGKEFFDLKKEREELLTVDRKKFEDSISCLSRIVDSYSICVVGGESAISAAGSIFDSVNKLID